jgi:hypothetical protein
MLRASPRGYSDTEHQLGGLNAEQQLRGLGIIRC